ncbi:MAG: outer membrane beta-barrel protein [Alistipes sp.]
MKLKTTLFILLFLFFATGTRAQHTFGITGGYGMSTSRLKPTQEMKGIWGRYNAGISWRHYGKQRFVGGFGIDLEFIQQGFSFAPNASTTDDKADYQYYTRKFNSVMLPIVWQPHAYIGHRVRIFVEAAATFSYNFSSTYNNELKGVSGDYNFRVTRDNRWGYGLAGGGGVSVLVGRIELMARVRYYFGFADIVRNRNKYPNNNTDGAENPFYYTPMRSPTDNLSISIGVAYRFNKEGFDEWKIARPKREKIEQTFDYKTK